MVAKGKYALTAFRSVRHVRWQRNSPCGDMKLKMHSRTSRGNCRKTGVAVVVAKVVVAVVVVMMEEEGEEAGEMEDMVLDRELRKQREREREERVQTECVRC